MFELVIGMALAFCLGAYLQHRQDKALHLKYHWHCTYVLGCDFNVSSNNFEVMNKIKTDHLQKFHG